MKLQILIFFFNVFKQLLKCIRFFYLYELTSKNIKCEGKRRNYDVSSKLYLLITFFFLFVFFIYL